MRTRRTGRKMWQIKWSGDGGVGRSHRAGSRQRDTYGECEAKGWWSVRLSPREGIVQGPVWSGFRSEVSAEPLTMGPPLPVERNTNRGGEQRRSADSIAMLGMRLDGSGEEVGASNDWDCPRGRATVRGSITEAILLSGKKELIRWPQHFAQVAAEKRVYVQCESGLGSAKRATMGESSWQALALCGTLCAADVEKGRVRS